VTTGSAAEQGTDEARVLNIGARLADLRAQTLELASRASQATEHASEIRLNLRTCNHAGQAQQMTATLAQLEHELEGLRIAMQTRGIIEQAKGMLMLHRHCTADEAFAALVELSQNGHRKLADVAQALVTTWTASDHVSA
jgi:hypothetical protein